MASKVRGWRGEEWTTSMPRILLDAHALLALRPERAEEKYCLRLSVIPALRWLKTSDKVLSNLSMVNSVTLTTAIGHEHHRGVYLF